MSHLLSLRTRRILALLILTAAIVSGGYVAYFGDADQGGVEDGSLPPVLEFLAELEIAHIAAHMLIFGSVAVLLAEGKPHRMAWRYIWRGAIVMELVQAVLGFPPETVPLLIWSTTFDLIVDGLSGWLVLRLVEQWRMFRLKQQA